MAADDNEHLPSLIEVVASLQFISSELEIKIPKFSEELDAKIQLLSKTDKTIEALYNSTLEKINEINKSNKGVFLPPDIYSEVVSFMAMVNERDAKRWTRELKEQKTPPRKHGEEILSEIKELKQEMAGFRMKVDSILGTPASTGASAAVESKNKGTNHVIVLSVAGVLIFCAGIAAGVFLLS